MDYYTFTSFGPFKTDKFVPRSICERKYPVGNTQPVFTDLSLLTTRYNPFKGETYSDKIYTEPQNFTPLLNPTTCNVGSYLSSISPMQFDENNKDLITKQNELIGVKTILENQIKQNKELLNAESEYCNKMKQMNLDLLQKIKELADENDELNYQRKKVQQDCSIMQKQINFSLMALMNRPKREPEPPKEEILPEPAPEPIQEEEEESIDKELEEKKRRYRINKEKIYTLNLNHNLGKLDEIRKKQLEEQLRKEKEEIDRREEMNRMKKKYERPIVVNTTTILESKTDPLTKEESHEIKGQYSTLKKMDSINPHNKAGLKNKLSEKGKEKLLPPLNSKKVKVEEKEKVLGIAIEKLESYARNLEPGVMVYKEKHWDIEEYEGEIRILYEDLKTKRNIEINIDLLPMVIFLIIYSNYNVNLNQGKLENLGEYKESDFDSDLNEDYVNIVNMSVEHLKRMIKAQHASKDVASIFLAKAVSNFDTNEFMLERVEEVMKEKLSH